jgi:peptide deformylase
MKLPLTYYGDPILRKKGEKVKEINDEIREFINNMIDTMVESNNSVGLSAPQVNRSLAIFVTCHPVKNPEGNYVPGPVKVYINPRITSHSEELWPITAGCMSIPGIYAEVRRPRYITVEAMDINGNTFTENLAELEAHIVLHENDHCNGVLFIDRIRGKAREELEPKLREVKKKYCKGK